MADVQPLHALHYDLGRVGGLQPVAAPPYDVIDARQRAELVARSPYNVVEIDLPQNGGDPYAHAADVLRGWTTDGIVVRDPRPALWALAQDYTGPDGRARTRHGVFARVRVEDYGPGRIRPHERTHPGPKEDRLRLTRATRANLSPIFSLYDDPAGAAWRALAPHLQGEPWGEVTDSDDTRHRVWRVEDVAAIAAVREALAGVELLIADGHHRYETARVYAQEPGAAPGSDHVLMCLVALQDPGLTVFPTHRLVLGLDEARKAALREALERDWDSEPADELEPASSDAVRIGYYDGGGARMLTLKDPAIAAAALPGKPEPYRRLDTAVLEALLLKGALGMTEDDISHLDGLDYARTAAQARERVDAGDADAAFFMAPTPVSQVRDVAAAGENMPPKSTYFFPKVLTGMVFNPLEES
ncbi:DUF1015 domain-containing protein [Candidatus Solirubrobacter pratensis]|uniref:DUF1015 domain-containing protein n=1 Tax=Candidatus Solirubrobacter pratensis TaxID=1298857 RepID=UPI0009DB9B44|nr:DUF1015 domain-containing protein [Candidatus Solirubrobacter pratensis]